MAVADYTNLVQSLYIAYFGRPADTFGLQSFATQLNTLKASADINVLTASYSTSAPLKALIDSFGTSAESTALYGTDTVAFVTAIYNNVLSRAPDYSGLVFWVNAINSGSLTKANASLAIMAGAVLNNPTDALTVSNKVAVAASFTTSIDTSAELNAYSGNVAAAAARAMLNTVTSTTAATTFQPTVDATLAQLVATSTPGQTFTLTTGVDAFVGGLGNDVFNAILGTSATLAAFDSINGGAGVDTLNLVDSTAGAFALPTSVTVSNIETVNVSRATVAGDTSIGVTITDTTFGAGVKTLNVIESGLATNITAMAGASITLNSANTVSVIDTGAARFATVSVTDTSATVGSTGSTLATVTVQGSIGANTLTGNAITTVNLNNDSGLTSVVAAAGTRALVVNTSGTVDFGGLTDATATTLSINNSAISGATKVNLGTFTAAVATTVNYSSTAADASATIVAAKATSLNVSGSAVATLAFTTSNLIATVAVTGTAGLGADLTSGATGVTLLDTTATTGKSTVTVNAATVVNGGAGADFITVGASTVAINLGGGTNQLTLTGAALGTGGTANGGTGTADTLNMTAANAATASGTTTFATAVTGFEHLTLTSNSTAVVDVAALGNYNFVTAPGGANQLTLNNLTSGATVNLAVANSGGIVLGGSFGSGTSDILNLGLTNATSTAIAYGTITAPNVENINIVVTDGQVTPTGNLQNSVTLTDAALVAIKVSGTSGLAVSQSSGTALTSFDASGVTNGDGATGHGVSFTSNANQYATTVLGSIKGGDVLNFSSAAAAVTITETAGVNAITGSSTVGSTLTGGTGADTIVGGAGNDTINAGLGANTITGGAGADSITLNHAGTSAALVNTLIYTTNASSAGAAGINMDTITNFATSVDHIQLQMSLNTPATSTIGITEGMASSTVGAMGVVIIDAVSVATVAAVYTQLATDLAASSFAASASGSNGIVAREVTFANGAAAGTYLVINDGSAGFQSTDVVIKLVGTTTVVAGDIIISHIS